MSSTESAPASIPATNAHTSTPALAPLSVGTLYLSWASSASPACYTRRSIAEQSRDRQKIRIIEHRPSVADPRLRLILARVFLWYCGPSQDSWRSTRVFLRFVGHFRVPNRRNTRVESWGGSHRVHRHSHRLHYRRNSRVEPSPWPGSGNPGVPAPDRAWEPDVFVTVSGQIS